MQVVWLYQPAGRRGYSLSGLDHGKAGLEMECLFKNDVVKLYWDDNAKLGVIEWQGAATGDAFRQPILKGCEILKTGQGRKVLNDGTHIPPVPKEDEHWFNEVGIMQLVAVGVKYLAVVLPKIEKRRIENLQNVQAMMEDVPITVEYFLNTKDAKQWLLEND